MDEDKALGARDLADFLTKMFLENQAYARHHEQTRSAATTMFGSLATLLVAVSAAFWEELNPLLVGAGLIIIGGGGFFLNMKLFERSAIHLRFSEAYKHTLDMMFWTVAKNTIINEDLIKLRYIEVALDNRTKAFERDGTNFRGKRPIFFKAEPGEDFKDVRHLNNLNPAAPESWVAPVHNYYSRTRFFRPATHDLYRIGKEYF